jgi:hypothetical protein
MRGPGAAPDGTGITFFSSTALTPAQTASWRAFGATVPWAHYRQDPVWAQTERQSGVREPRFFWGERDGGLCLAATGIERRLPVPGFVFWEFNFGPTCTDPAVLSAWLTWLPSGLGRSAARVRVQPAAPLTAGGEEFETVLKSQGFLRDRSYGGWTTPLLDIARDEEVILAGFRNATRRAIKKSQILGVTVGVEDTPDGWRTIAELQTDLGRRAPVPPLDTATTARISNLWLRGGEGGTVLVARHQGAPVAAALVVAHNGTAYLPIIPSRRGAEVPASHLLVWESVRWAKAHGCAALDFVGYAMTAEPGGALAGINQFKRGFVPLDNLVESVAMHEKVLVTGVVALARAARRAQTLMRRGD